MDQSNYKFTSTLLGDPDGGGPISKYAKVLQENNKIGRLYHSIWCFKSPKEFNDIRISNMYFPSWEILTLWYFNLKRYPFSNFMMNPRLYTSCVRTKFVHYFRTYSPFENIGELELCPVTIELAALACFFHIPVVFVPESFPSMPSTRLRDIPSITAELQTSSCFPNGNSGDVSSVYGDSSVAYIRDLNVFEFLSSASYARMRLPIVYPAGLNNFLHPYWSSVTTNLTGNDVGDLLPIVLEDLIRFYMKHILMYLLWLDDEVYLKFTRKVMFNSVPSLMYYVYLWREKRFAEQMCNLHNLNKREIVEKKFSFIMWILNSALQDKEYFGGDKPSNIDAVAFAYLSVLFSIPIYGAFYNIVISYPNLVTYVKSINGKFSIWKNPQSFLHGISSSEIGFNGRLIEIKSNRNFKTTLTTISKAKLAFILSFFLSCALLIVFDKFPVKISMLDEND